MSLLTNYSQKIYFKTVKKISRSKLVKASDDEEVWKNVKEISALKGRYQLKPKEGLFLIERTVEEDAGTYNCSLGEAFIEKFTVYGKLNKVLIISEKYKLKQLTNQT